MMKKKIISLLLSAVMAFPAFAQDRMRKSTPAAQTDSVLTYASLLYKPNSFLRTLLMGKNYRNEWERLVRIPVFRFSGSGFTIKELGGGMQTKSLRLVDSLGREWALRTIDKDVTNAGVKVLRNPLGQRIAQDMISAAFPYGAVLAGELAHAIGLQAATPQVFFIADDPALGPYRSIFAHTLCSLEEREPGYDDTDNSEKTLENLSETHRYKIQQPFLLKARLLDMLIADWDRHADNWRWGQVDSAGFQYYYAVPRDRDWAFFKSKGLLPMAAQLTGAMRCFVSFGPELKNIKDQSWKAWTLDKRFLNEMDAADWAEAIRLVQAALTDDVIEAIVKKLPAPVYQTSGQWLINCLRQRRDDMPEEIMKYYRFLAEEPLIYGSGTAEHFVVSTNNNGVTVTVYTNDPQHVKLYERSFHSSETYFIHLYGLGGDDLFEVTEDASSKIRLVINGGDGEDRYNLRGKVRTKVNDSAAERNELLFRGTAKVHFK